MRKLIDSKLSGLSRDEEKLLLDAIKSDSDDSGKAVLISSSSRTLLYFANRYEKLCPPSLDKEDLISEGIIGILNAIRHYDYEGPAKFSTFASYYIRSYMLLAIRRAGRLSRSSKGEISINTPLYGKYEDMTIAGILKDEGDPIEQYEKREESLFIQDCIELLDSEEKQILRLQIGRAHV